MRAFDADLRGLSLRPGDLADLRWFGVRGALLASGDGGPATREAVRAGWEALTGAALRRLGRAGLAAFAALGIHPRCIPWRGLEALLSELPEFLGRPGVVAVGAVGLDEGGEREEEAFLRQLALARDLRLAVMVHTPWRAKERLTRRTLALLREADVEPRRVLVARADRRTARMIRACGFAAGLSLSAGRGDGIEEAVELVRTLGPEGLVLGSGAGEGPGDLLALPRAAGRLAKAGLSPAVVRRVCGGNAVRLLGISADRLATGARRG